MFSAEVIENLLIGLQVTLYGLGGVFAVLLFFFLMINVMMKIASKIPEKSEKND